MSAKRCNTLVYNFGGFVAQVWAAPGTMEPFVEAIRKETKKRYVDWHSSGGYGIIKCIGNNAEVYDAVVRLAPNFKAKIV